MQIFFATKNKNKIDELSQMLNNENIEIISINDNINISDVIEDKDTFEGNSQKKAVEIAKELDMITISDDSGLCVEALNDEPGIYSARYSGEEGNHSKNIDKVLSKLEGIQNRKAKFVSVISIARPNGQVVSFRGETEGEILESRVGENGFGYDPIFFSNDLKKSFGIASSEEKNSISHRGRAFEKLVKYINDNM